MGQSVSNCCKCNTIKGKNGKHLPGCSSNSSYIGLYDDSKFSGPRYKEHFSGSNALLTIENMKRNNKGLLLLSARTPIDSITKEVDLHVNNTNTSDEDEPPIFTRRLSDFSVKVGTKTKFLVEIMSNDTVSIMWFRNELPVLEGDRYHFSQEGNFYCLDVTPITLQDSGRWICTAENHSGCNSSSCHLNVIVPKVYKPPVFLEELKALLTEQGTVSLECKVIGVPTPVLRWFKDGLEIKAGDVFALTANADDPTSLGTYTCEASNCMGKKYSSSKVHVIGRENREGSMQPADSMDFPGIPPIFAQELKNYTVNIGGSLILSCQVVVPPWPKSIVWYNSNGRVDIDSLGSRYRQITDGLGQYAIEINPSEAVDQGEWKCAVTAISGVIAITKCDVNMNIPKNYRKPRFMESLKAILTDEGLVSFECKVVGFPTPYLRWFKDGQELKPGDVYQLTGTNSLGSYCCIARNCMGEAVSSAELTIDDINNQLNDEDKVQLFSINQPPKFIRGLKSCEAKINEPFRFTIQVSISPPVSLVWFRDDQQINTSESNSYIVIKENLGVCHLDIRQLEFIDQAEWKCIASTEFGESTTSCFLQLIIPKHYKKPRFLESLRAILSEDGAVNLECKVIGVPQPVLKWYKDGEELKPGDIHRIVSEQNGTCCLGTYTCEASNCMGIVTSSASLLGFEDKVNVKEFAKGAVLHDPSLSTINEERTSQIYDTPKGDMSLSLDDKGEVSFSFDGKEVSVSLYETPDLTEEEALQIVEMYAEQLSEHVSEHNAIELPPLRFVKETSTSGNLLMDALVIDISPDFFISAEEDLKTEVDVDEMSTVDETRISLSPEITAVAIEKKDSLRSQSCKKLNIKSESERSENQSFYSLPNDTSLEDKSEISEGDIEQESFIDTFVSAKSSYKSYSAHKILANNTQVKNECPLLQSTHEIGSDLNVADKTEEIPLKIKREKKIKISRSYSESSDELNLHKTKVLKTENTEKLDLFFRDVQGEEGDGLVCPQNSIEINYLISEKNELINTLKQHLFGFQNHLFLLEEKVFEYCQSKSVSSSTNKILETLNKLIEPFQQIQASLAIIPLKNEEVSLTELFAPDIINIQNILSIFFEEFQSKSFADEILVNTSLFIMNETKENLKLTMNLIKNIIDIESKICTNINLLEEKPITLYPKIINTLHLIQNSIDTFNFSNLSQNLVSFSEQQCGNQIVNNDAFEKTNTSKEFTFIDIYTNEFIIHILQMLETIDCEMRIFSENTFAKQSLIEAEIFALDKVMQIFCEILKNIEYAVSMGPFDKSKSVTLILEYIIENIQKININFKISKSSMKGCNLSHLKSFQKDIKEIIHYVKKFLFGDENISESQTKIIHEVYQKISELVLKNFSQVIIDFEFNIKTIEINTSHEYLQNITKHLSIIQNQLLQISALSVNNVTENFVLLLDQMSQPLEFLNQILQTSSQFSKLDFVCKIIDAITKFENILNENNLTIRESDLRQQFHLIGVHLRDLKNFCVDYSRNVSANSEIGDIEIGYDKIKIESLVSNDLYNILNDLQLKLISEKINSTDVQKNINDFIEVLNMYNQEVHKTTLENSEENIFKIDRCFKEMIIILSTIEDNYFNSLSNNLLESLHSTLIMIKQQTSLLQLTTCEAENNSAIIFFKMLKSTITTILVHPVIIDFKKTNLIQVPNSEKWLEKPIVNLENHIIEMYSKFSDVTEPIAIHLKQIQNEITFLKRNDFFLEKNALTPDILNELKKFIDNLETVNNYINQFDFNTPLSISKQINDILISTESTLNQLLAIKRNPILFKLFEEPISIISQEICNFSKQDFANISETELNFYKEINNNLNDLYEFLILCDTITSVQSVIIFLNDFEHKITFTINKSDDNLQSNRSKDVLVSLNMLKNSIHKIICKIETYINQKYLLLDTIKDTYQILDYSQTIASKNLQTNIEAMKSCCGIFKIEEIDENLFILLKAGERTLNTFNQFLELYRKNKYNSEIHKMASELNTLLTDFVQIVNKIRKYGTFQYIIELFTGISKYTGEVVNEVLNEIKQKKTIKINKIVQDCINILNNFNKHLQVLSKDDVLQQFPNLILLKSSIKEIVSYLSTSESSIETDEDKNILLVNNISKEIKNSKIFNSNSENYFVLLTFVINGCLAHFENYYQNKDDKEKITSFKNIYDSFQLVQKQMIIYKLQQNIISYEKYCTEIISKLKMHHDIVSMNVLLNDSFTNKKIVSKNDIDSLYIVSNIFSEFCGNTVNKDRIEKLQIEVQNINFENQEFNVIKTILLETFSNLQIQLEKPEKNPASISLHLNIEPNIKSEIFIIFEKLCEIEELCKKIKCGSESQQFKKLFEFLYEPIKHLYKNILLWKEKNVTKDISVDFLLLHGIFLEVVKNIQEQFLYLKNNLKMHNLELLNNKNIIIVQESVHEILSNIEINIEIELPSDNKLFLKFILFVKDLLIQILNFYYYICDLNDNQTFDIMLLLGLIKLESNDVEKKKIDEKKLNLSILIEENVSEGYSLQSFSIKDCEKLQEFATPLIEMSKNITSIRELTALDNIKSISSTDVSQLKTLAKPLQDIIDTVILIENNMHLEYTLCESSRQNNPIIATIAQTVFELHQNILMIQNPIMLESSNILEDNKIPDILSGVVQSLENFDLKIAAIVHEVPEQVIVQSYIQQTFSELIKLATPLHELQRCVADICIPNIEYKEDTLNEELSSLSSEENNDINFDEVFDNEIQINENIEKIHDSIKIDENIEHNINYKTNSSIKDMVVNDKKENITVEEYREIDNNKQNNLNVISDEIDSTKIKSDLRENIDEIIEFNKNTLILIEEQSNTINKSTECKESDVNTNADIIKNKANNKNNAYDVDIENKNMEIENQEIYNKDINTVPSKVIEETLSETNNNLNFMKQYEQKEEIVKENEAKQKINKDITLIEVKDDENMKDHILMQEIKEDENLINVKDINVSVNVNNDFTNVDQGNQVEIKEGNGLKQEVQFDCMRNNKSNIQTKEEKNKRALLVNEKEEENINKENETVKVNSEGNLLKIDEFNDEASNKCNLKLVPEINKSALSVEEKESTVEKLNNKENVNRESDIVKINSDDISLKAEKVYQEEITKDSKQQIKLDNVESNKMNLELKPDINKSESPVEGKESSIEKLNTESKTVKVNNETDNDLKQEMSRCILPGEENESIIETLNNKVNVNIENDIVKINSNDNLSTDKKVYQKDIKKDNDLMQKIQLDNTSNKKHNLKSEPEINKSALSVEEKDSTVKKLYDKEEDIKKEIESVKMNIDDNLSKIEDVNQEEVRKDNHLIQEVQIHDKASIQSNIELKQETNKCAMPLKEEISTIKKLSNTENIKIQTESIKMDVDANLSKIEKVNQEVRKDNDLKHEVQLYDKASNESNIELKQESNKCTLPLEETESTANKLNERNIKKESESVKVDIDANLSKINKVDQELIIKDNDLKQEVELDNETSNKSSIELKQETNKCAMPLKEEISTIKKLSNTENIKIQTESIKMDVDANLSKIEKVNQEVRKDNDLKHEVQLYDKASNESNIELKQESNKCTLPLEETESTANTLNERNIKKESESVKVDIDANLSKINKVDQELIIKDNDLKQEVELDNETSNESSIELKQETNKCAMPLKEEISTIKKLSNTENIKIQTESIKMDVDANLSKIEKVNQEDRKDNDLKHEVQLYDKASNESNIELKQESNKCTLPLEETESTANKLNERNIKKESESVKVDIDANLSKINKVDQELIIKDNDLKQVVELDNETSNESSIELKQETNKCAMPLKEEISTIKKLSNTENIKIQTESIKMDVDANLSKFEKVNQEVRKDNDLKHEVQLYDKASNESNIELKQESNKCTLPLEETESTANKLNERNIKKESESVKVDIDANLSKINKVDQELIIKDNDLKQVVELDNETSNESSIELKQETNKCAMPLKEEISTIKKLSNTENIKIQTESIKMDVDANLSKIEKVNQEVRKDNDLKHEVQLYDKASNESNIELKQESNKCTLPLEETESTANTLNERNIKKESESVKVDIDANLSKINKVDQELIIKDNDLKQEVELDNETSNESSIELKQETNKCAMPLKEEISTIKKLSNTENIKIQTESIKMDVDANLSKIEKVNQEVRKDNDLKHEVQLYDKASNESNIELKQESKKCTLPLEETESTANKLNERNIKKESESVKVDIDANLSKINKVDQELIIKDNDLKQEVELDNETSNESSIELKQETNKCAMPLKEEISTIKKLSNTENIKIQTESIKMDVDANLSKIEKVNQEDRKDNDLKHEVQLYDKASNESNIELKQESNKCPLSVEENESTGKNLNQQNIKKESESVKMDIDVKLLKNEKVKQEEDKKDYDLKQEIQLNNKANNKTNIETKQEINKCSIHLEENEATTKKLNEKNIKKENQFAKMNINDDLLKIEVEEEVGNTEFSRTVEEKESTTKILNDKQNITKDSEYVKFDIDANLSKIKKVGQEEIKKDNDLKHEAQLDDKASNKCNKESKKDINKFSSPVEENEPITNKIANKENITKESESVKMILDGNTSNRSNKKLEQETNSSISVEDKEFISKKLSVKKNIKKQNESVKMDIDSKLSKIEKVDREEIIKDNDLKQEVQLDDKANNTCNIELKEDIKEFSRTVKEKESTAKKLNEKIIKKESESVKANIDANLSKINKDDQESQLDDKTNNKCNKESKKVINKFSSPVEENESITNKITDKENITKESESAKIILDGNTSNKSNKKLEQETNNCVSVENKESTSKKISDKKNIKKESESIKMDIDAKLSKVEKVCQENIKKDIDLKQNSEFVMLKEHLEKSKNKGKRDNSVAALEKIIIKNEKAESTEINFETEIFNSNLKDEDKLVKSNNKLMKENSINRIDKQIHIKNIADQKLILNSEEKLTNEEVTDLGNIRVDQINIKDKKVTSKYDNNSKKMAENVNDIKTISNLKEKKINQKNKNLFFITNLTNRTAALGSSVKFICSIAGFTEPKINWYKDLFPLNHNEKFKMHYFNGLATLEIKNITLSDNGQYTCEVKNDNESICTDALLKVFSIKTDVESCSSYISPIKEVYDTDKKNKIILECKIHGNSTPKIEWFKNGHYISSSEKYQLKDIMNGTCTLIINNPNTQDSGRYTCSAANSLWSEQTSHYVNIEDNLSMEKKVREVPATKLYNYHHSQIANISSNHLVPLGGTIGLQVEIKGSSRNVVWLRDNIKLPKYSNRYKILIESGVHTFLLPKATAEEVGTYTCRIINENSYIDTSTFVEIIYPNSIPNGKPAMFLSRPEKKISIIIGQDITVSCTVSGNPRPKVIWMKGIRDITNNLRTMKERYDNYIRFTLKRITLEDGGTYCIMAKNIYGCDRVFFTVIPKEGRCLAPLFLLDENDANLYKLTNKRNYLQGFPAALSREPYVHNSGNNWICLSWGKSNISNISHVLGYRVEMWLKGGEGARWQEIGVTPSNNYYIFNLKYGSEYIFRVTPRNRFGWGESVKSGVIKIGKSSTPPEFIKSLPIQTKIKKGMNITLECQVQGYPIPRITWYKDNIKIEQDQNNRHSITQKDLIFTLNVTNVTEQDSGKYICQATNELGRTVTYSRIYIIDDMEKRKETEPNI